MKFLILAAALVAPSFAQTQTVVDQVFVSGEAYLDFQQTMEEFYAPVIAGGAVVGVNVDLDSTYYVHSTVTNPFQYGINCTLIRGRLVAHPGGTPSYITQLPNYFSSSIVVANPNLLAPGAQYTAFEIVQNSISERWGWPSRNFDFVKVGDALVSIPSGPPWGWYWRHPQSQQTWDGSSLPAVENTTFEVEGTLTWEWEPYLDSVTEVCAGDGHQQIALVGEWGANVRVVSNYLDQFSLIFRGEYQVNPGSSFCIGAGQRITESMKHGAQNFQLDLGTINAGETFTLQAAHRFGFGEVRISNALLVTPL